MCQVHIASSLRSPKAEYHPWPASVKPLVNAEKGEVRTDLPYILPGNYWASLLTGQGFGALGLFVLGAGCCLHPGVAPDVVELIPFAYLSYHHIENLSQQSQPHFQKTILA